LAELSLIGRASRRPKFYHVNANASPDDVAGVASLLVSVEYEVVASVHSWSIVTSGRMG